MKDYVCDCGKVFSNYIAIGNHKRVCPVYHMNTYGNLDKLDELLRNKEKSKIRYKSDKIKQWVSEQHTCKNCGKVMTSYFGSGTYCSKSCANSRKHTDIEKQRISDGVRNSPKIMRKYANPDGTPIQKFCTICGTKVEPNNSSGYCLQCIQTSPELAEYRHNRSKYASSFISNHVPWKPRNETPYSEKFWTKVLDNNSIPYKHDYTMYIDNKHWYYADFYIEQNSKKLDLEIDGKQHNYPDRKQHDMLRDEYLTNHGYIVYRIKWNEINSDSGKSEMKDKINKFLAFYYSL